MSVKRTILIDLPASWWCSGRLVEIIFNIYQMLQNILDDDATIKIPIKFNRYAITKNFLGENFTAPNKATPISSGNGDAIIKPAKTGISILHIFERETARQSPILNSSQKNR